MFFQLPFYPWKHWYILILAIFFSALDRKFSSLAQAVNDDIEDRIQLNMNSPITSATVDCTLQWECLNHSLTKKCIQYHNDQWFFFRLHNPKKSYINISNQDCRDLRGVQLLIIDGVPCEPETYQILKCVSLGNHDDVFVSLDSLESQNEYLLLVDGYLHDFCSFQIELSDQPKGQPLAEVGIIAAVAKLHSDNEVEIEWKVPDSIAARIIKYEIFRRKESLPRSEKIDEVAQQLNAYGIPKLDYTIEDCLPDFGDFYYNIVAVSDHNRMLISKLRISNPKPKGLDDLSKNWIKLDLDYPDDTKLKIYIYDEKEYSLLYWSNFIYTDTNRTFQYNIEEYYKKGVKNYRIVIENLKNQEKNQILILK